VIDTHTGGEPTRVVVAGGPDLGSGPIAERLAIFCEHHDTFRSAVVNEPRGSDVMVGALVLAPADPAAVAAVIFFNNVGFLGMCGHGAIGVGVALAYEGRLSKGTHRLETPVGPVALTLESPNTVAIENVASYRLAKDVKVEVPGLGTYTGDVAWGGNWFFLVHDCGESLCLSNADRLIDVAWRIRKGLSLQGISGAGGAEINHIELLGPATQSGVDARSFVLCPGRAYDRSPCGTGTSAKIACLVADGKLSDGQIWRQESVVGSVFEGSARVKDGQVWPRIRGSAYVSAESTLIIDPADPFALGIRP
jgi:4-hydroxyproline epimerase